MDKCYKDGVLPNNWNLITFSVGLLKSATSRKDRLWGARVLDTFIGQGIPIRRELLTSTQAIQNLIDMIIGPTRTYDPEIRERAARILADLASELRTWVEILGRSRTIMSRLISAGPTDNTTRLRRDMSCNVVAIRNLMHILEAHSEGAQELQEPAIEILTELAFDDSFRKLAFDESTSMTEIFVKTLRRIFHEDRDSDAIVANQDEEKDKRMRRKTGEALARLLRVPNASTFTTNAVDQILSSKPKKAMRAGTRQFSAQGNEEQSEDRKMLAAMLSLTVAISNKNVISGDDFTRAIPDDVAAFVKKHKKIVEKNMDATTDGWRIQKLVCQVVIATVQLKPGCIRELNGHNFEQALSKALETMLDVDYGMLFAGNNGEVPARSLTSLVKEAHELLAQEHGDIIPT